MERQPDRPLGGASVTDRTGDRPVRPRARRRVVLRRATTTCTSATRSRATGSTATPRCAARRLDGAHDVRARPPRAPPVEGPRRRPRRQAPAPTRSRSSSAHPSRSRGASSSRCASVTPATPGRCRPGRSAPPAGRSSTDGVLVASPAARRTFVVPVQRPARRQGDLRPDHHGPLGLPGRVHRRAGRAAARGEQRHLDVRAGGPDGHLPGSRAGRALRPHRARRARCRCAA